MPLTGSERTLPQAGESRKLGPARDKASTTTSRDASQQRGASARNPAPQHGQENVSSRRLSTEEAATLKLNVPNTILRPTAAPMKRQTSQSTDDEKENAEPYQWTVKKEPELGRSTARRSQYNEEDDDTSMTFDESGWEPEQEPYGQQTTIFRGNLSSKLAAAVIGSPSLKAEAAKARAARGCQTMNQKSMRVQYGKPLDFSDGDDGVLTDDDYELRDEDTRHLVNETPSRAGTAPATRKAPANSKLRDLRRVEFDLVDRSSPIDDDLQIIPPSQKASSEPPQPEVNPHSSLARHVVNREQLKQIPAPEPPHPAPVNPNVAAKVSSFDEAAPTELQNPFQPPPATTATKRTHDEIDYDLTSLKSVSYSVLDEVPFLTDPRAPPLPAQVDTSGNPLPTLSARLNNLSKMRPADQKNLFLSLTDSENEQTGQFFIQSFSDNLKKLMEKRLERRKIALKYELEARKREKAVEMKQKDCETELGELKTGGGKLVAGRSVAKIGMTPRKGVSMPLV